MSIASRRLNPGDEDPLAVRSPFLFWAFGWYLRWFFWRHFDAVRVARGTRPTVAADRPLIIYTNHPSWWDPALFMLLANTILRDRIGFGPMSAVSLGQYGVFRRLGVFGIDLDSGRGAARFMAVGLRILGRPSHMLWITAEGHFTDTRSRPVRLRPGLAHLARRVPHATILPLAVEYPFWNEKRPEALVRFGPPVTVGEAETGVRASVAAWNEALETRLAETMDALAADAMSRDPQRFERIMGGHAGVGGLYDLWRRCVAWTQLRRPHLAHERPARPHEPDPKELAE